MRWWNALRRNKRVDQVTIVKEPVDDKPDVHPDTVMRVVDIREPVYSFIDFVKRNKTRFKVSESQSDMRDSIKCGTTYTYSITDKVTNEYFECTRRVRHYGFYSIDEVKSKTHAWLTTDELNHVLIELEEFFSAREAKLTMIHLKRRGEKDRKRLMSVYAQTKHEALPSPPPMRRG